MPGVMVQPQWKPHPTKPIITGYLVYAWIGHKLLGEVRGTRRTFKSKKAADKYAKSLRAMVKKW